MSEERSAENGALTDAELAQVRRCPDCGHDWSGHVDPPLFGLTCEGKRGLSYISCRCAATLPQVVERIVVGRLTPIRAAVVEEYGEGGHDVWCPHSPHYEQVSDHPRGDRPCDCLAGKLWPHLPPEAPNNGDPQ